MQNTNSIMDMHFILGKRCKIIMVYAATSYTRLNMRSDSHLFHNRGQLDGNVLKIAAGLFSVVSGMVVSY